MYLRINILLDKMLQFTHHVFCHLNSLTNAIRIYSFLIALCSGHVDCFIHKGIKKQCYAANCLYFREQEEAVFSLFLLPAIKHFTLTHLLVLTWEREREYKREEGRGRREEGRRQRPYVFGTGINLNRPGVQLRWLN